MALFDKRELSDDERAAEMEAKAAARADAKLRSAEKRETSAAARKAKAEAKKAAELDAALVARSSVYVLSRHYISAADVISWVAFVSVVYFLLLYCFDEARDVSTALQISRVGTWQGHLELYFPLMAAFLAISAAVALYTKYGLAFFMSLDWKEEPRVKVISGGLLCITAAVVLLGSFSMMQGGRIEGHRGDVVQEQRGDQRRVSANARLEQIKSDLRDLMGPEDAQRPSTQQQACRAGQPAWRVRIGQTPASDPQHAQIVRAISDAFRCDQLRTNRDNQAAFIATLPVEAVTAARVVTATDAPMQAAVDNARNSRSVILAMATDLLAIFVGLIALTLRRVRQRQLVAAHMAAGVNAAPAPAQAAEAPIPEPGPAEDLDNPDEKVWLSVPKLPDNRDVEEPDFDRLGPVDEQGRRLKRVAGHFRPEAPAPSRGPDARRPADPDQPAEPAAAPSPAGDDVNFDDIINNARAGERVNEAAK